MKSEMKGFRDIGQYQGVGREKLQGSVRSMLKPTGWCSENLLHIALATMPCRVLHLVLAILGETA